MFFISYLDSQNFSKRPKIFNFYVAVQKNNELRTFDLSEGTNHVNPKLLGFISSLLSCRTASTDSPDPLPPPVFIVHRFRRSSRLHPVIGTELLYIAGRLTFARPYERDPPEYITHEFVLTSPAVSRMPGSSKMDSFRDGCTAAVLWGVASKDLFNTARNILVK